jgi:hypothetical protein
MLWIRSLLLITVLSLVSTSIFGQESKEPSSGDPDKIFVITKNDGSRFVGRIISEDAREILIDSREVGRVFIPRHEIREIRETVAGEVGASGDFMPAEVFSTRYFITTNGLPVKKGETYILWSLFGPDIQFGVAENFGAGIMTSWVGIPIIGSLKYSLPLAENVNAGIGLLLGTGSWAAPEFAMALPYGVLTFGDRVKNINFSIGYGGFRHSETNEFDQKETVSEGNLLVSVAGLVKVSRSVSIVFDSFIIPRFGEDNVALIMPGVRVQTKPNRAFQFGFAGIRYEGKTQPLPIPMVQWFMML